MRYLLSLACLTAVLVLGMAGVGAASEYRVSDGEKTITEGRHHGGGGRHGGRGWHRGGGYYGGGCYYR